VDIIDRANTHTHTQTHSIADNSYVNDVTNMGRSRVTDFGWAEFIVSPAHQKLDNVQRISRRDRVGQAIL